MKNPSTWFELAGFMCLSWAVWWWNPIAGLAATGVSCVLVGYAFEDERAVLDFRKILTAWRARRAGRKAARMQRRVMKRSRTA